MENRAQKIQQKLRKKLEDKKQKSYNSEEKELIQYIQMLRKMYPNAENIKLYG